MNIVRWLGLIGLVLVAIAVLIFSLSHRFAAPARSANANKISDNNNIAGQIRYLPLGDSYTIGQSVAENQRWPNQLVKKLAADNVILNIVGNPAVTGYTTKNLIDRELPLVAKLNPDFITIQIGVNDYVQGISAETFQKNLNFILDSVQKEIPQPRNIVLVTIPDYAKTPTGAGFGNPAQATAAISNFNKIIAQAGADRALTVADVFATSQKVTDDPSLIAGDGLHPSGAQYGLWTNIIYQSIKSSNLFK